MAVAASSASSASPKDVTALKVAEAELELAHQRLVETSRLAGMAEVASDVLHNVGNTLNSINVSCSLVIDAIKRLSFNNLARIPLLLQENAGRLDEFLTNDPRGKHIPQYLAAIPAEFEEQKRFVLGELGELREHVDHVNQIVAMQQSYAQVAGVQEPVDIARLVDDAIQINAAALQRHTIDTTVTSSRCPRSWLISTRCSRSSSTSFATPNTP